MGRQGRTAVRRAVCHCGVRDQAAYEERFRRAGLPLLIEDYSARDDVFTRAYPLLALVFLAELFGALNLEWSLAANVAAVAGGLAILLGGVALANRRRGQPALAQPQRVDALELTGFVFLPALLPAVFGGQLTSALVTAAGNSTLLVAVYAVVGFGLLSIVRWAGSRMLGQLAASLRLLARAIPLLFIFAVVLFMTVEVWEVATRPPAPFLVALALLFVVVGVLFLVARLPREVAELEHAAGTGPPLSTAQRFNVGLVMFVSQALQVLIVSIAIGAFFIAFGLLAIDRETVAEWTGGNAETLVTLRLFGESAVLTAELLHVCGGIAVISGLYYAIAVLTDDTYREEFLSEVTEEMRTTFSARAEYLAARSATGAAPTA